MNTITSVTQGRLDIYHAVISGSGGNQSVVLLAILTSVNMTGTSTRTPTIVAKATGEVGPNREIATATDNSKKLDAPIIPAGAAIQ